MKLLTTTDNDDDDGGTPDDEYPIIPEFYGDLVYKFKYIIGNPNFSDLFKRIVNRFQRAGYTVDSMQQTAYLVFNPIMVEGYAALFCSTSVDQASDSMTASM